MSLKDSFPLGNGIIFFAGLLKPSSWFAALCSQTVLVTVVPEHPPVLGVFSIVLLMSDDIQVICSPGDTGTTGTQPSPTRQSWVVLQVLLVGQFPQYS